MREASLLGLSEVPMYNTIYVLLLATRGALIHEYATSQSYLSPESIALVVYSNSGVETPGMRPYQSCKKNCFCKNKYKASSSWCGTNSAAVKPFQPKLLLIPRSSTGNRYAHAASIDSMGTKPQRNTRACFQTKMLYF